MSHDKAMAASGEPAVGDERNRMAQSPADDGPRRAQHLAHARAALRSLVSNDHHVAWFYLAAQNALQRLLLGIEYACPSFEAEALLSCNFCNGAFGGEVAIENHQVTVLFDGVVERPHDFLVD